MNQGALHFEATLGTKSFSDSMQRLKNEIGNVTDTAQKEAAKIDSYFRGIGLSLGAYFSGSQLLSFTQQVINIRGEFQKTEIAFTTMLGSADKARFLMERMVDLAAKTPFGLSDVTEGAKRLLAFQVPANQVIDTLTRLGNVAAGLSVPIDQLIHVYGQVKAQGRVMSNDLYQFMNTGMPIIPELAKVMKVEESAVKDLVGAGKVGFKEIQQVIQNLTNEGGMFFNLMEAQSASLSGKVANLGDAWDQMLNKIGRSNQGLLYGGIEELTDLVEHYESVLEAINALVLSYGAYKAAIIATNFIQEVNKKTIQSEIALLGISEKMKLGRALVTQRQAAASLQEASAELASARAKYTSLQTEISSLAVKKQAAVQYAANAQLRLAEARIALSTAQAEQAALSQTATAREINIAAKRVETAQNNVIAAQETASIARKRALAASSTFYTSKQNLENAAVAVGAAEKAVANAEEALSVATKNANTIATERLTIAQRLQAVATTAAARAQAFLNSTILANPYALATAFIVGLTYSIYKYSSALTTAEESQQRMSDDMRELNKDINDQKIKIDTLVKAINDQNTTDDRRAVLINQIKNLSNGRLNQLTQEAFKTGEATKMIKEYIKTLQLEAEAKKYVNELGKIETDIDDLKSGRDRFGMRDIWEDLKDYDSGFNVNLKARKRERVDRIVKEKEEERKEIQKKLDDLAKKGVNITDPLAGNDTGTSTSGGKQGWAERIKAQIEEISAQMLKAPNEAAYRKLEAQKKKLEDLLSPPKQRDGNRQLAEIFPSGSIKKLERDAQLITDALLSVENGIVRLRKLDKFGQDKDKKGNPYFTGEQVSIKEAKDRLQKINEELELKRNEIQVRSFDEEMSETERQWRIRYKLAKYYGEETAKAQFPQLKGTSYFDEISKQFRVLEEKRLNGTSLSNVELTKWEKLKTILDGLTGAKDPLTDYTDKLEKTLDKLPGITQQVAFLKNEVDKNSNDKSDIDQNKLSVASQKYIEKLKEEQRQYSEFLNTRRSFEEKRLAISEKYASQRDKIDKDRYLTPDQKKYFRAESFKAEGAEISKAFIDGMANNPEWSKAFQDLNNVTTSRLKAIRKSLVDQINLMVESGTATPESLKALQDKINEIDNTVRIRNPFKALADAIKSMGDEADKSANKQEKIKNIALAAKESADLINQGITSGLSIAEDLGAQFSDETKDIIADVQTTLTGISDLASGIATMNPASILKGIAGVIKGIAGMFNGDKKKERQIKSWANEVENLKNMYKELEYAVRKALGDDIYKGQIDQIKNLQQQQQLLIQMRNKEADKKKSDQGKINDYNNQINDINRAIQDIRDNIIKTVLQTDAKDLASQLGDALIEAFSKGEDAAKSLDKVAGDVFKNMVKNALKLRMEKALQPVLDQILQDSGFNKDGTGSFKGFTPEQIEQYKKQIAQVGASQEEFLKAYQQLFQDVNSNISGMEGSVKSITSEEAGALIAQINAMRINQGKMININQENLEIIKNILIQLMKIEENTRKLHSVDKNLAELNSKVTNNSLRGSGL